MRVASETPTKLNYDLDHLGIVLPAVDAGSSSARLRLRLAVVAVRVISISFLPLFRWPLLLGLVGEGIFIKPRNNIGQINGSSQHKKSCNRQTPLRPLNPPWFPHRRGHFLSFSSPVQVKASPLFLEQPTKYNQPQARKLIAVVTNIAFQYLRKTPPFTCEADNN